MIEQTFRIITIEKLGLHDQALTSRCLDNLGGLNTAVISQGIKIIASQDRVLLLNQGDCLKYHISVIIN